MYKFNLLLICALRSKSKLISTPEFLNSIYYKSAFKNSNFFTRTRKNRSRILMYINTWGLENEADEAILEKAHF